MVEECSELLEGIREGVAYGLASPVDSAEVLHRNWAPRTQQDGILVGLGYRDRVEDPARRQGPIDFSDQVVRPFGHGACL
jgi:hypothetical protein